MDLTLEDNVGPTLRDLGVSRTVRLKHSVSNAVGVDSHHSVVGQERLHLALPTGETATEYPPTLLSAHEGRR